MPAPPVGTGDASTQQLLDNAYTQARQDPSLQGSPSGLMRPYQGGPSGASVSDTTIGLPGPETPPPGSVSVDEPPEGATNPFDQFRDTPPPGAQPVEQETHGNGDPWSVSNLHDFLRDEFKGTGKELVTALPRAAAKTGSFVTFGAAGLANLADKTVSAITGTQHTGAQDAVFDFHKNYVQPAIESWTPERTDVTGEGEGSGGAAQAIGGAAEFAPKMLLGGAGAADIAAESGIETARTGIEKGQSLRTAAATGAVDAVANGVQAMVPGAALPLIKRVLVQVPAGDMAAIAGDFAKKKILESGGRQKEADAIDPLANLGQDTLQNLVFATMGGHEKPLAKGAAPEAPIPEAQPIPPATTEAAQTQPPPPVVGGGAPQSTPAPGAPAKSPIPDTPTPEPAKDLKAQWTDMNAAATPRSGVLVPKGQDTAIVDKAFQQAKDQGRTVDLPQGTLVLKNKTEFLKAKAALDAGQDPQQVIGRVTGAGEGKQPDQTAVVQGQTKDGAVAIEGMVKPEDVAAKVAEVQAQGKQPVVTTPKDAIERRQAEIQAEVATKPPEGAVPVAEPEEPEEPAAPPTARRGIAKTGGGDRAVILEGEPEGGKQKVRVLDDEGQPSDEVVSVPSESVSTGESSAVKEVMPPDTRRSMPVEGGAEIKPAPSPKAASMLEQLRTAAADFEKSQQPPSGRKYPGSIKDRVQNVSTFARALKAVAERSQGIDAGHAISEANAAIDLDMKSDEALAKGQGVGHTELSVHTENLLNAARKLIDPDFQKPEPKIAKQEKLKAKQAAKKEPAPEPKREVAKPAEKVKVIADVPDETKPKDLTKGDQLKLKQAGDRLIKAKDEDTDARAADVEKLLHEIYNGRMSKDDSDTFMAYLMAERRDRLRPISRDKEIEDELGARGVDYRSAEPDELEHAVLGNHEVGKDLADLHARLEKTGMYSALRDAANTKQFPAREILQHMATQAHNAPLQDLILRVARNLPDNAVIRPVDKISRIHGDSDERVSGLANNDTNVIQVKMRAGGDSRLTHTLLHEATHLVTANLGRFDPAHPFVAETKRLRQIFENRMRRRLGDQLVQQHVDYLSGRGERPTEYYNDLYGLKNHAEFLAEAGSNPQFRRIIAQSEKFADRSSEGFLGGVHKLADAIVDTLRRALGIDSTKGAKLLHSVMTNLEDTITAQRQRLDMDRPSAAVDLSELAHLNDDPKPLRDEPRLRGIVGNTASVLTRQWYRASQGRAVPALRRVVLANETHDQIIRSNSHWFGNDNEHNPLRQYDAAVDQKNALINRHLERARPVVLARQRLDRVTDTTLGNLQSDSTRWGIDPTKAKADVPEKYTKAKDFDKRYDELQTRWNALPKEARHVYEAERDHYAWAQRQLRRTAVDAALDTFSDRDISGAQRSLLYNARTKGDFDSLVGTGRLVDVGDRNDSLKKSIQELASVNNMEGPYFHLGRHGEYVVQVHPDVDQNFSSQAEAEAHAQKIRDMGPRSKAKVDQVGEKWNVDGQAQYVSMHANRVDAEAEAERLRGEGHKVGQVTQKIEAESGGALTKGMQTLIGEATRKLAKRGDGPEVRAMSDALRGTFVQMVAARSAYAASKLSRAGFAGVKGEEMGRNFATHAQSMAWNIGNLATTFRQGEALGKIREMSKRPDDGVPQRIVYKRGAVMGELGKRLGQEVSQYGLKNPVNAITAKLGYMNFLASPSHTGIYLTQNFTTAYPTAGARWGYGKALGAFGRATQAVVSPTMRATFKASKPGEFGADDMVAHVIDAIKQHPTMGKWAPQLRELMDRGIITNTFAHEVGHQAQGGNATVQRAFDYARIMPQMVEVYNRVSTALAGLELTGGDLQKTADFVRETHVDYSQANKTRVGKTLAKLPGANTVTMFHTYVQGMRHLLYSNIKNMVYAETKSRAEAAKTVAGLVVAMSLTAGVIKGAALEPLRGAVYAYNKVFGDSDEFYSLDNSIRRFVASVVGNKTVSDAVTGGLPHLLGFDLSGRMGLSDLFLHNPPDLLSADKKAKLEFLGEQLGGPMAQMVAEQSDEFKNAMTRGDSFGMLASLVPVKLLRDSMKASELATTGKRTATGAQLTKPSGADALTQVMGFKPADVARAQERQGDVAEYRGFIADRKQAILGAWGKASPDERATLRQQINDFNAKNPGDRIKVQDLIKIQRSALRSQQRLETGNDANPNIKKLLNY